MTILAIGAHPDNIETSCGGILSKYAKQESYKNALGNNQKDFFNDYRTIARYRGIRCGVEYAEGFRLANNALRVVPCRVLP